MGTHKPSSQENTDIPQESVSRQKRTSIGGDLTRIESLGNENEGFKALLTSTSPCKVFIPVSSASDNDQKYARLEISLK